MPLDFRGIEPEFADPFLLEMDWGAVLQSFPSHLVFRMEMGEFDHFEPLWTFLRAQGVQNLCYSHDFLILPSHIRAANAIMPSLWPEIHRTRQFFHPDDDPFWALRDLFERLSAKGWGLLAMCD